MIKPAEIGQVVAAALPALASDIYYWTDDLFHLQVSELRRHAQEAIDKQNLATVRQCFEVATLLRDQGAPEVRNAVAVSFLEGLRFSAEGAEAAIDLLTPSLRKEMSDLDAYMTNLIGESWTKDASLRKWPAG